MYQQKKTTDINFMEFKKLQEAFQKSLVSNPENKANKERFQQEEESLLLELYRELWGKFQRDTSLRIDKEHKFHFKEYDEDITNIVNENNIKKIFNCSSMDNIVKSFGSVFVCSLISL